MNPLQESDSDVFLFKKFDQLSMKKHHQASSVKVIAELVKTLQCKD